MSTTPSRAETRLINTATDAFIAAKNAVASVGPMKARLSELRAEVEKLEVELAASDDVIASKEKALEDSLVALETDRREKGNAVTRADLEKMVSGIVDNLISGGFASIEGAVAVAAPVRRGRRKASEIAASAPPSTPAEEVTDAPAAASTPAEEVTDAPAAENAPAQAEVVSEAAAGAEVVEEAVSTPAPEVASKTVEVQQETTPESDSSGGEKESAENEGEANIVADGTDGLGDVGDIFPGDEPITDDGSPVTSIEDTFDTSHEGAVTQAVVPAEVAVVQDDEAEKLEQQAEVAHQTETSAPVEASLEAPVVIAPPARRFTAPTQAKIIQDEGAAKPVEENAVQGAEVENTEATAPADAPATTEAGSMDASTQDSASEADGSATGGSHSGGPVGVIPPRKRRRFDPATIIRR